MASSYRVLIVVQDRDLHDILLRVVQLTYASATIFTAADSATAWHAYQQHGADLVIVDEQLPIGAAWDVVQRLRAAHATLPILLFTWDHGISARAVGAGVTQVFPPPMDVPRLMDTLRQLLPP
jgi:DNA-binding response OmpR family regulator